MSITSAFHVFPESEPISRSHYSRKDKSLGLLCSNFLKLYNREGVNMIGLDDASSRLGIERRRIYDVVNILETVGIVARKGKNTYRWQGFEGIPGALEQLKEEGLKENSDISGCSRLQRVMDNNEEVTGSDQQQDNTASSMRPDNKREKSLWLLSQNFVKLFLQSDVDIITLDGIAKALLGDGSNLTAMRTKERRLYDIANIFSSINLIEKTPHPESRKPAFRWLGWRAKPQVKDTAASDLKEQKKRAFGDDITNYSSKKNKLLEDDMAVSYKNDNKIISAKEGQVAEKQSKGYVFGPFTPFDESRRSGLGNATQAQDWENLASTYRPQYQNTVLGELFSHYLDAWKSWYAEVAEKKMQCNEEERTRCSPTNEAPASNC